MGLIHYTTRLAIAIRATNTYNKSELAYIKKDRLMYHHQTVLE
jgi:hypothetical protein